jgi:nitroreductase
MAELLEVVRSQRACRRFDPAQPVPDVDIEAVLEAAVHAPSAENSQPWAFVVVREPATREALAATWAEAWAVGGGDHVRSSTDDALFRDIEDGMANGGFGSAPVVIIVGADHEVVAEAWAGASIYPAVQNLLLAAADLGYGTCLTTGLTTFFADQVRELLSLPPAVEPMAAVYLGRAARALGPPRRRPARTVTYRERFGQAW